MNKIYRVVWNAELGQWVVASEVAKGRKKKASASNAASLVVAVVAAGAAMGSPDAAAASAYGYLDVCGGNTGRSYSVSGVQTLGCGSSAYFDLSAGTTAGISSWGNGKVAVYGSNGISMNNETSLTNHRITNLANGVNSLDAVNLSQLKAVEAKITTTPGTGNGIDTSAVHYDGTAKDKVTLAGTGGTTLTNLKEGSVASGSKDAVTGNQLFTTNQNVTNLTNNFNTLNTTVGGLKDDALLWKDTAFNAQHKGSNAKITNMAAGTVGATSTDAVNGSQLYGTANSVAQALGGGSAVNTDGTISKPAYTVNKEQKEGVQAAIEALDARFNNLPSSDGLPWDATNSVYNANRDGADKRITGVANALNANDAVNKRQLDEITDKLAPKLKYIKFGNTDAADAFATGRDSVAIGGNAVATGNNALAIGANSSAVANSVAIGFGSAASESGTFAVGGSLKEERRRIVNVARGEADSDAATVGQLNEKFAAAIRGASQPLKSGSMLQSSTLLGATMAPTDLIKIGTTTLEGAAASGEDSVAIGLGASAVNTRTLAIGVSATASNEQSVAIGQSAISNGKQSVAIGSQVQSYAENSLAIGTGGTRVTSTGKRATSIGYDTVVGGENTVALGNGIRSAGLNNVVLGNLSSEGGRGNNIVSVGSAGAERQVIFVKAGTQDTDAVNVSQLKSVAAAIGGNSKVGTDGMVTLPTYKINGTDTTGTLADGISKLDKRVSDLPGAADALLWDTSAYSAKHGGVNSKINNLGAGTVSAASSDAINGSQLYATNKTVSDAIGGTGAGLNDDGTIKAPTFKVGDKDTASVADAITALQGLISEASDPLAVKYDTAAKDTITLGGLKEDGTKAAAVKLTNLADASERGDAVNLGQLQDAGLFTPGGDPLDAVVYDEDSNKAKVTFGGAKFNSADKSGGTKLTNVAVGTDDSDAVNVAQLKAAGIIGPNPGDVMEAVVYDKDSNKAKVTFGGAKFNSADNSGGTTLANVAVGKADADAVNVKQLKDAGLIGPNPDDVLEAVVYDKGSDKAKVTFGGANGTVLANVAAGLVSDTSKQAVNGSQLYATNKVVSDALGGTGAGLNADGSVKAPKFTVGDKTYNSIGDAFAGIGDAVDVDAIKWDGATAFSAKHGGAAAKLTNLAAGAVSGSSTDAINGSQLFNTAQSTAVALGGGSKVDAATGEISKPEYTVDGTTVKGVDGAIAALNGRVNDSLRWDGVVGAYTASHTGSQNSRIINVENGDNANDAVNLSQLRGTADSVAAALGGGATVGSDGKVTKPTYTIADKPYDSVGGAFDAINKQVLPNLKFIKFGATTAPDAFATGYDAVAIGGNSVATGNYALAIGANSSAVTNSVAIGFGSAASEAGTFAVGGSLSTEYRRIVNVANGQADNDAATVGQLNAKFAAAVQAAQGLRSGSMLQSSSLLGAALAPTDLIKVGDTTLAGATADKADSLAIGIESSAVNEHTLAVGVAAVASNVESVAMGQGVISNGRQSVAIGSQVQAYGENSLSIGSGGTRVATAGKRSTAIGYDAVVGGENTVALGNSIRSEGSNNVVLGNKSSEGGRGSNLVSVGSSGAERQVIFVKAGTQDTDAVNVSQLKSAALAIGSSVGTDGLVTTPKYTIDGKETTGSLADGISKLDTRISGIEGGGAGALSVAYDSDDKGAITLKGADGTIIGNLADGVKDDQAVTVAQLKGVAKAIGGGAGIDEDGKITAPEFAVTKSDGEKTKVDNVGEAITTIDGRVTNVDKRVTEITNNYTQLSGDVLKWNGKAGAEGAYTAAHGDQATSRITNVADAVEQTDAVNKKTMNEAINKAVIDGSPLMVAYDDDSKTALTLGGKATKDAGQAVTISNLADATKGDEAVNLGQLQRAGLFDSTGKALEAVVYDANTSKASVTFGGANGTVLGNVADGLINANSRQAVNGGQLFKLQGEINQQITNLDQRVTKVEVNVGPGSAPYISANPQPASAETPTAANAGDTAGIAMGYSASASGEGASALGDHAVAQAKDSVAIGNNATVTETATNSVALGNHSVADSANTVSIGSAGNERTISHLARGNADTDAATMGQVRETLSEAKSYTDSRLNDVWQGIGEEIDHVNRQANRGIAAASALINVTPYVPGHTTVNAGAASYRGETALGIGVSRWSDNGRLNLNAGVSAAQNDEPVFRVGVGYIF